MEFFETFLKWVVAPVAGFVWLLHRNQQSHATDIAVLKATMQANKEAHDREFKELKSSFKAVLDKLDSIETYLRK